MKADKNKEVNGAIITKLNASVVNFPFKKKIRTNKNCSIVVIIEMEINLFLYSDFTKIEPMTNMNKEIKAYKITLGKNHKTQFELSEGPKNLKQSSLFSPLSNLQEVKSLDTTAV